MLRGDGSGLPARLDSSAEKLTRTVKERRKKDPRNSLEWERYLSGARWKVPSLRMVKSVAADSTQMDFPFGVNA